LKRGPYEREDVLRAFDALMFRVSIPDTDVAGHGDPGAPRRTTILRALEAWKTTRRHIETGWYVPLSDAEPGKDRSVLGHLLLLNWWVETQSEGPSYVAVLCQYIGSANRFAEVKAYIAKGAGGGWGPGESPRDQAIYPLIASIEILESDVLSVALIPDIFGEPKTKPGKRPRAKNRRSPKCQD